MLLSPNSQLTVIPMPVAIHKFFEAFPFFLKINLSAIKLAPNKSFCCGLFVSCLEGRQIIGYSSGAGKFQNMILVSNLFSTFVVEWPQNGNFWNGLIEGPSGFGMTQKGEFKRKMRNSENPATEFLLIGPGKRETFEVSWKSTMASHLDLYEGKDPITLVHSPNWTKHIGRIQTLACYFIKQPITKSRTCSKGYPNPFPGHGTIYTHDLSCTS